MEEQLRRSQFMSLRLCEPKNLVRLVHGGRTEWAFVGRGTSNDYLPVIILKADGPLLVNAMGIGFGQLNEEYDGDVLSYGERYLFEPDESGPCSLADGSASVSTGCALQHKDGSLSLAVSAGTQRRCYEFGEGRVLAPPAGRLVIFSAWTLSLLGAKPADNVVVLRWTSSPS